MKLSSFENEKQLQFRITLGSDSVNGQGTFVDGEFNQITLDGLRASVDIDLAGALQLGTCRCRIFGVSKENMDAITVLQWKPKNLIPNTLEVWAIDGPVKSLVYAGNIVNAWADYSGQPDVFLHIQAQQAYFHQLRSAGPRSYEGQIDVATVVEQIAHDMGYSFQNYGVNVILSDVVLKNTLVEQIKTIVKSANINMSIDVNNVVSIWPKDKPKGTYIAQIDAQTGLIGYPTIEGNGGINTRILYRPDISQGIQIDVKSISYGTTGQWIVMAVAHSLSCNMPNGPWFSTIRSQKYGLDK